MLKRSRDRMQETKKQGKYFVDREKRHIRKHTSTGKPEERGSESSPHSNSHVRNRRTNIKDKTYTDAFLEKCDSSRQSQKYERERPFTCHKRGTSCVSDYNLSRHTRIHTGGKSFTCETCSKSFSRKDHLKSHKRIHTSEIPFPCDICFITFTRKSQLDRHRKTVHKKPRSFVCSICQKSFNQKKYLVAHRHTPRYFSCLECSVTFRRKDLFTKHTREKHRSKLPASNKLKNLFTKHTPEKHQDELPVSNKLKDLFTKHTLEKSIVNNDDRLRHTRFRTREKSFTHKDFHTEHSPETTSSCRVCLQSFCGQTKYPTYIEKHAGKTPFTCLVCLKKYPLYRDLVEHYRIHLKIKPFVCNFCTKPFTRRSNLLRHIRAHTEGDLRIKDESFVCKTCSKTFRDRSALTIHSSSQHPTDRQTPENQPRDFVTRSARSKVNRTSFMCPRCHESISRLSTTRSNIPTKQKREKSNPSIAMIAFKRAQSSSKTLNPRLNTEESSQNNRRCSKRSTSTSDFVASSSDKDCVDTLIPPNIDMKSIPPEKTTSVRTRRMARRAVEMHFEAVHRKIKLSPAQKDVVQRFNGVKVRSVNSGASTFQDLFVKYVSDYCSAKIDYSS